MAASLASALQPGLGPLRDIRGIEGVPWWPLAEGWWMLIGALVLIGLMLWHWRLVLRLRVPIPGITLGSWRWDAAAALRDLRRRARAGQDPKSTAGELSELLRRIAMARLGRPGCAGLVGEGWLAWLAANDPAGFDWVQRGRPLLDTPYAPPGPAADRALAGSLAGSLLALIDAAYVWVSAPVRRAPKSPESADRRWRWRWPRLPRIPGLLPRRTARGLPQAAQSQGTESGHV